MESWLDLVTLLLLILGFIVGFKIVIVTPLYALFVRFAKNGGGLVIEADR